MVAPGKTRARFLEYLQGSGGDLVIGSPATPDDVYRMWVAGDAFPRVVFDIANGGVLVGNGTVAPTALSTGGGGSSALNPAPVNQTFSGLTVPLTYGAACTISSPVYYTASKDVRPANANTIATSPAMGIALATASSGSNNVGVGPGVMRDDTNLTFATIGAPVYLGATAGTWTQTPPSATDQVVQAVGFAFDTHVLLFLPNANYITHA